MNKQEQKKLKLFNLFSRNLEWVKEHPSVSFQPDFVNGYICPICFDVFFEKDLMNSSINPLTFEDIPPLSLGGKKLALTCKKCNSWSGHELDIHLLNSLLKTDSQLFLPNSKSKITFESHGSKMNGALEVDKNGIVILKLHSERSNPEQSKQFIDNLFYSPKTIYSPFFYQEKSLRNEYSRAPILNMKFNKNPNERRAEVALLRIAYLLAYATFGNGFYINGGLYKVREQILNPDKEILPKCFWLKYDFPKKCEGINIISLPKELQCFLVVFNLQTESQTRQFAIVLPGPSDTGLKVYDFISKKLCVGDGTTNINVMLEPLPKKDFLRNKEGVFASSWYWQEYTKDDYKPR
jgi:hypothetical protein